jgi:hypothetical protein
MSVLSSRARWIFCDITMLGSLSQWQARNGHTRDESCFVPFVACSCEVHVLVDSKSTWGKILLDFHSLRTLQFHQNHDYVQCE